MIAARWRAIEGVRIHILIFEAGETDKSIFQEVIALLSQRADIQIAELLHNPEYGNYNAHDVLTFPGLKIYMREQTVYKDNRLIPMSYYEFSTLCFLAKHPGWVFTKQQIYEAVWNEPEGDCNTAITNVISQIRKKLHPNDPKNGYIKTVVNSGYKFETTIT